MKIGSLAQNPLRAWCAEHDRTRKPRQHVTQAKTTIESVSRFGQIAPRIFALPDRVIDAVERTLDVAQYNIDPTRAFGFGGLTPILRLSKYPPAKPGALML
jgi:hypothetical protein